MTQLTLFDSPKATAVADASNRSQLAKSQLAKSQPSTKSQPTKSQPTKSQSGKKLQSGTKLQSGKKSKATRTKTAAHGNRRPNSETFSKRMASKRIVSAPITGSSRGSARDAQDAVRRFSDGPSQLVAKNQLVAKKTDLVVAKQQDTSPTNPVAEGDNQPLSQLLDKPLAQTLESPDGVQRMGDLARLVLMRYEIVAKRRAIMAEKQRQKTSHA